MATDSDKVGLGELDRAVSIQPRAELEHVRVFRDAGHHLALALADGSEIVPGQDCSLIRSVFYAEDHAVAWHHTIAAHPEHRHRLRYFGLRIQGLQCGRRARATGDRWADRHDG